jgi:hypothetical protein
MSFQIDKRVTEKVKPLADAYTRDRNMVMGGMVDGAKTRLAAQFSDFAEHAQAIDEFVRNYPADVLAQPGALEEAYYRVKGRAVTQREAEAKVREQAGLEGRGRVGVGERREEPKISEEQLRIASNFGVSATEFNILEGPGSLSIDEYMAAKAKAKGGNNATR